MSKNIDTKSEYKDYFTWNPLREKTTKSVSHIKKELHSLQTPTYEAPTYNSIPEEHNSSL
jgi:hypothetical protein